jgi:hypothetical protein
MKFKPTVSSSRRKGRKAHFASDSESRRILMSTHLSKDLREKHNVRTLEQRRLSEARQQTRGVFLVRAKASGSQHLVGCPQSGTLEPWVPNWRLTLVPHSACRLPCPAPARLHAAGARRADPQG